MAPQAGAAPVVVDNAPGSARTFLVPKERELCVARVLETLEEQLERERHKRRESLLTLARVKHEKEAISFALDQALAQLDAIAGRPGTAAAAVGPSDRNGTLQRRWSFPGC